MVRRINILFKSSNVLLFMIIFVLGIVFIPGAVAAAGSGSVYVSTSGNDSWDGLSAAYNSSSGSGPKATIKNATSVLATNGTVHVASGTYRENQINITNSMSIVGENKSNTIINGTNSGFIFNITSGVYVTIVNLTLTRGQRAIYNNGILTLNNTKFTNNTAYSGGAIYNLDTLTVYNTIFTNNNVTSAGGAIYNLGKLTLKNTEFTRNNGMGSITYGGAIYNRGPIDMINTVFKDNTAGEGGAIYSIDSLSSLNISRSTFNGNIASDGRGGAINSRGGVLIAEDSLFTNNRASESGGAICNEGLPIVLNGDISDYKGGSLRVNNCTFTNNTARFGGGIYNLATVKVLTVNNSTFTGNTEAISAGGQTGPNGSGSLNVTNSTFIGNTVGLISGNILNIDNCTFTGNSGSISTRGYGISTISNSTFLNNTLTFRNSGNKLTITNITVSGNTFANNGLIRNMPRTGIDRPVGEVNLINSVITGNTGSLIWNFDGTVRVINNVISNNTATSPYYNSLIYNDRGELYLSFNQITDNIASYLIYSRVVSVDADNNWWGSNDGTNRVSINGRGVSSWLVLTHNLDQVVMEVGKAYELVVDLWHDNLGNYYNPEDGHVPDGLLVELMSALGTFGESTVRLVNGSAHVTFTPTSLGNGNIVMTFLGQTIEILVQILEGKDNTGGENNTNTTNNSTNSSTDNGGSSPTANDGSPTGSNPQEPGNSQTPGDTSTPGDGSPTGSVPQEPGDSQTQGDMAFSAAGESVGDRGQSQKSYEINTNTTGSSISQPETLLVAIIGVALLLVLVGVGYYFKK